MTPYYTMTAADPGRAEISLYGEIGGGWFAYESVTAKQFAADLKGLGKVKHLDIYINSPGGSVFEGLAIYNQLKRHRAQKTVYIDGLAASIASVIAMAGDEIVMPATAYMMIHKPSGVVMGTAEDMRDVAASLEKIETGIVAAYVDKTGQTAEKVAAMMADETWMTMDDAITLGFADTETAPVALTACAADFSHFKRPPAALMQAVASAVASPPQDILMTNETLLDTPAPADESDPPVEVVAASDPLPVTPATDAALLVVQASARIARDCTAAGFPGLAAELIAAQASEEAVAARLVTASQIKSACDLAKMADRLNHYLASGCSVAEARSDLFGILAARDQQAVTQTALPAETTSPTANLPLEDRCKADWQANPALRSEFGNAFDAFLAYSRAAQNGQVRVFQKLPPQE